MKDDNVKKIEKLNFGDKIQKFNLFVIGTFLSALGFNLFISPYNIVTGGSTGIALIVKQYFNINISLFVLIINILFMILSFVLLGKRETGKSIIGSLLFPFFLTATYPFVKWIDLSQVNIVAIILYGGIITGFATGLIMKAGYTTGGLHILYQLMNKYLKISIGNASRIVNSIIIVLGGFVYGVANALYALVVLYVSSLITDRVILGVSDMKSFYIITNKEKEIKEFILNTMHHSFTVIDVRGGYTNDKRKMLMCVIPTSEYLFMRDVIKELDPSAFFLITDAYETIGEK